MYTDYMFDFHTMSLAQVLLVVWSLMVFHFIGDFAMQTSQMALNKSKSFFWLTLHVFTYTIPFWIWSGFALGGQRAVYFLTITFLLHMITDAITSRLTSKYWYISVQSGPDPTARWSLAVNEQNRKKFWLTIGFDQLIHATCLLVTLWWVVR